MEELLVDAFLENEDTIHNDNARNTVKITSSSNDLNQFILEEPDEALSSTIMDNKISLNTGKITLLGQESPKVPRSITQMSIKECKMTRNRKQDVTDEVKKRLIDILKSKASVDELY